VKRPGNVTGDITRVRSIGVAAASAAVIVAVVAIATPRSQLASPGPLARPHVVASVSCEACHGARADVRPTSQPCIGCHGPHPSTRDGHRALARGGALDCATCHPAHGEAAGVTFAPDGRALRWSGDVATAASETGPPGITVPLVALSACTRCHDLARLGDPIRACAVLPQASPVNVCFDEHQSVSAPLGARGVCVRQHGEARFVAWDAARSVAADLGMPTVARSLAPWTWVASAMAAGGLAFAGMTASRRVAGRGSPKPGHPTPAAPVRVRLPQIDAGRCLGCHACVDACPFDVLAVERHVAVVARPEECCGVATCEKACPNGSLRLADEGQPVADQPRVDAHLESMDAPGIFLAGDLTGVPLIRNAILQGAGVADCVADGLLSENRAPTGGAGGGAELLVVGAGPAGLSAALRAKERGLSCVVLEQSTMAASIRAFPRGKVVHDPPIDLPLEGALWLRESTKEELLAQWRRVVRTHGLDVREGHRVTRVTRDTCGFAVSAQTASDVVTLRASRVLLAIGRRGTPRRLDADVAPSAASHVLYALSDARALAGRQVLVVGLGDSAMEAIVALARQPGTAITVSYRGAAFVRGRARNVEEVQRLAARGRIRVHFHSTVVRVDDRWVLVRDPGGLQRLRVDVVLALLGGVSSRRLLDAAGVRWASG